MPQDKTPRTYKTFWTLLAILIIALIAVLAYELSLPKPSSTIPKQPTFNTQAGLGELGAQCGGELRLPCKPGLKCLKNNPQDSMGICAKATDKEPGKVQPI